jgi:MFS family permease
VNTRGQTAGRPAPAPLAATAAAAAVERRHAAWAPLRHRVFRWLWIAQFVSNIGTWMQLVGAQWLMGTLGGTALEIALVQAAVSLPVFVVSLPAGALGDIVDRRRLLLFSMALLLVVSAVLAAVTFSGAISPWLLLGLTTALGASSAFVGPTWQAIVPELVERDEITAAAGLAATSFNLSRAIGPAIGGVVVAAAGPGWNFALNAASYVGVLVVLRAWRRPPPERVFGPEHIRAALRTGLGYVRHAPRLRAAIARAALFVVFAGALWAVLPIYARADLHIGSAGYGGLLGAVGLGAVGGALLLPRLVASGSADLVVSAASVALAAAALACAAVASVLAAALALVVAGGAWVAATSSLNGTALSAVPEWVGSRALAVYGLVFGGGQAVSAVGWGEVTQLAGARAALAGVGGGLLVTLLLAPRWRLAAGPGDLARHAWPVDPPLAIEPDPATGPILVTVEYEVPAQRHRDFRERMREVGRARRRTGAEQWGLFQDGASPDRFLETFLVATWEEHLRQHTERTTAEDEATNLAAVSVTVRSSSARHLFYVYDQRVATEG